MKLFLSACLALATWAAVPAAFAQNQGPPRSESELKPGIQVTVVGPSSPATPQTFEALGPTASKLSGLMARMDQKDQKFVCFTIRSYQFVREAPDSDAMKPRGYSTCTPAAGSQTRNTVESAKPK